ncbi:MAG: hypothetical protein V7K14_24940 [Nostoc sp.]
MNATCFNFEKYEVLLRAAPTNRATLASQTLHKVSNASLPDAQGTL